MIKLGLTNEQKLSVIDSYRRENAIAHTIVFSPTMFTLPGDWEQYTWEDAIRYKVFYPLLERINDGYLVVVNEMLRNKNRSELTYNCMHHYLNQTPHKIVFQWLPIIDDPANFMILADMDKPGRFKGRGLDDSVLEDIDISGYDRRPDNFVSWIHVSKQTLCAYEKKRDGLFDNLGSKDPDTIPRQLHLWTGTYKKPYLEPDQFYVARNQRFNLPNVTTYKDADRQNMTSVDLPHRRIELNDYLYRTESNLITFMATDLKVDQYYANELIEWDTKAGDLIAKTGIRPEGRGNSGR